MEEEDKNRYTLSSLPATTLTPKQWLVLVRSHWAVENNGHHTLDTVFEEDKRPWIVKDPQGMVVWRTLQTWILAMTMALLENDLLGLRERTGFAGI